MQLDLFPVTTQLFYKFEPVNNDWTGEPTGDHRLIVWARVLDPASPDTRSWIEGIYESSDIEVLNSILETEHASAKFLQGEIYDV